MATEQTERIRFDTKKQLTAWLAERGVAVQKITLKQGWFSVTPVLPKRPLNVGFTMSFRVGSGDAPVHAIRDTRPLSETEQAEAEAYVARLNEIQVVLQGARNATLHTH